jgi:hypothetical protein
MMRNGLNIRKDGTKIWYVNDQLHREDGPAMEWSSGAKEWYLHGKKIVVNSNEEFLRYIKLKGFWK